MAAGTTPGGMFLDELGSPNFITHYSTCFTAKTNAWDKMVANQLTIDIRRSKYMLFAGRNYGGAIIPAAMKQLTEARAQGRKIVVVDPVFANWPKSPTNGFYPPRHRSGPIPRHCPHAYRNVLYNKNFVQKYVFGFEEFWAANRDFSADKAAAICDIPAAKIREIARDWPKMRRPLFWILVTMVCTTNISAAPKSPRQTSSSMPCWGIYTNRAVLEYPTARPGAHSQSETAQTIATGKGTTSRRRRVQPTSIRRLKRVAVLPSTCRTY